MKYKLMFLISITFFLLYGCTENSIDNEQMPGSASLIEEVESVTESIPTMENEADNNSELVLEEIVQPTSGFEEVEDIEVIKEKALVAYQEYINSDEMLEYATPTGEPDRRYLTKYLIWDINGDEIPELHINNSSEYFIYEYSVEEDKAVCWKVLYPYNYPKEDGTMFRNPPRVSADGYKKVFYCYKFDQDGNEIAIVSFSMRDSNNDSVFDELDEYYLNGELCTYSEWREVAQDYLNLEGVDSIILSDLEYLDLVEWTVYCEAK